MPYKNKEDKIAYRRRIRQERREHTVCVNCGNNLGLHKRKYCSDSCATTYYDNNLRNPDRTKEIQKKWKGLLVNKIRKRISKKIKHILSGDHKSINYHNGVIAYTEHELRSHLEKRFCEGMTWENYGMVWHIDHIIPVSAFNLSCEGDIKRCWSIGNLQPMFAMDNIKKSNKLTRPFQPLLI